MSTGDVRRPEVSKISAKAVAADGKKPDKTGEPSGSATRSGQKSGAQTRTGPGAKSATKGGGAKTPGRPGPAGKGKGRKPTTPVKVNQGINWGPIAMFGGAGFVALLIIGFGAFQLIKQANQPTWQDRAAAIPGIHDYLKTNPDWFTYGPEGNHKNGVLTYKTDPPVGGVHNPVWQNCMGNVYPAAVPKEQATHALEHGAVWVAYQPNLPKDQIDALAKKVEGRSYMLMAPYPGLDKPISLQAWGYQLKVDNASDSRIDDFIGALRQNASVEPGATCSGGITDTGDKPLDLQADTANPDQQTTTG